MKPAGVVSGRAFPGALELDATVNEVLSTTAMQLRAVRRVVLQQNSSDALKPYRRCRMKLIFICSAAIKAAPKYLILLMVAMELPACSSVPQNEGTPASVAEVVKRIKEDLRHYAAYDAKHSKDLPLENACSGLVGFSIDNVRISLTTSIDRTAATSGSATLPVGGTSFGPSLSSSSEGKGSQVLTFTLYPKSGDKFGDVKDPDDIDPETWPVTASLKTLRQGLLEGSYKEPCFALAPQPPATDVGGSFVFGFTVTKQEQSGGTQGATQAGEFGTVRHGLLDSLDLGAYGLGNQSLNRWHDEGADERANVQIRQCVEDGLEFSDRCAGFWRQ